MHVIDISCPTFSPASRAAPLNNFVLQGKLEEPVRVSFLPFKLATHRACMILEDSICGKFIIELVAEVSLPKPATRLSFQVGPTAHKSLNWPRVFCSCRLAMPVACVRVLAAHACEWCR